MTAYVVFIRDAMKDEDLFRQYSELARQARGDHPIRALAFYGAPAEGAVVVEFPDMAAARAWYHSDAYQAAKRVREQAATYRVLLVEGLG
jgi:uncharacterized protein (DUF1330 family)